MLKKKWYICPNMFSYVHICIQKRQKNLIFCDSLWSFPFPPFPEWITGLSLWLDRTLAVSQHLGNRILSNFRCKMKTRLIQLRFWSPYRGDSMLLLCSKIIVTFFEIIKVGQYASNENLSFNFLKNLAKLL